MDKLEKIMEGKMEGKVERNIERTFVIIKPDAVMRNLTGVILMEYESNDLHLLKLKMQNATPEILKQHYAEHVEKSFYPDLEKFMLSGPLVAMVLEGEDAIEKVRRLNGATNPDKAEPQSIRGKYGTTTTINCVHGSDSKTSSQREIEIWFSEK